MDKHHPGSMSSTTSRKPNSLVSLVQGLGIKIPSDIACGKYETQESGSLSASADLGSNSPTRISIGSPRSFQRGGKTQRSISPIHPKLPSTTKANSGPRPFTTTAKSTTKPDLSSAKKPSTVKKPQPTKPAAKGKALSISASLPSKVISPPILKKKETPATVPTDAPAPPAPILTPQGQRELEASKNMVSPRIDLEVTRPKTARSEATAPKRLTVSRGAGKESKAKVLQSLVTKVGDTGEPGDQGRTKAEVIYRKHLYQTFRGLQMARSLPVADPVQIQAKRTVLLKPPGKYRPKTAIFDLDETLVHCLDRTEPAVPDVVLPIRFPNGEIVHANIKIRPYCMECLTTISEEFELIVFTASQRSYADAVLNYLDPHRTLIHHRLYRDSCVVTDKVHIKDLRVLANRSLKDVVLIDNASYSFAYQIDNGIPIVSWHYDPDDKELLYLTEYLKGLLTTDDVREVNQATFHLATFYNDYSDEFLNKNTAVKGRGK